MPSYIKDSGSWKQLQEIYIKDGGSWKSCLDVYVKDAGSWKSVLYEAGSQDITSYGETSFTVPPGVFTLTYTVYGAGGGSGACDNNGDAWVGSGGGAGGKATGTISTTPGETLTMVVGEKGYGASYRFNSNYSYNQDADGNNIALGIGTSGEDSVIKRGATALVTATGGAYGAQYAYGGAGGTPGVTGTEPADGQSSGLGDGCRGPNPTNYIGYGYTGAICGGTNGSGTPPSGTNVGTGYGNGGGQAGLGKGTNGQDGAILLEW